MIWDLLLRAVKDTAILSGRSRILTVLRFLRRLPCTGAKPSPMECLTSDSRALTSNAGLEPGEGLIA